MTSEFNIGTGLCNINGTNLDSGIECTFSRPADDSKLCHVADTLEGKDVIQRVFGRLERWASCDLLKSRKAKYKVLHMGQGNLKH